MSSAVESLSTAPIELTGKKVLLIGGAGFIGHSLALDLARHGANVTVADALIVNNYFDYKARQESDPNATRYLNFIAQRLELLAACGIDHARLDAREYHDVCALVDQTKPDVVIQLAAVAHANRSNKDPYSTFDHSLRTLENALDASRSQSAEVERFIFFSSSMVYGNFKGSEAYEDQPCDPMGIYGALKFAGEKMVKAYGEVFGLPYTIIRPSALYGERCVSRRVGQALIENAMQGLPLTIHGDGSDNLDFTYIRDLVDGVRLAIQSKDAENEVFNITYGSARSIGQMAEILSDILPDVEVRHKERDRLMPERGTLSIDKARALIGFDPSWPLERGFPEYIGWYLKHWGLMNEPPVNLAEPPAFKP
ncbi:MAG: NAD(P)-dependent oxidoreductase, partial [Pseudomonadota bacterium]